MVRDLHQGDPGRAHIFIRQHMGSSNVSYVYTASRIRGKLILWIQFENVIYGLLSSSLLHFHFHQRLGDQKCITD